MGANDNIWDTSMVGGGVGGGFVLFKWIFDVLKQPIKTDETINGIRPN